MRRYRGRNRRKATRKEFGFGTNIVRVNQTPFRIKWDDETGVNLGPDGFCCYSSQRLPERKSSGKTEITCLLGFYPPHDRELIKAEAILVWQRPGIRKQRRIWYHGFEFTKIEPNHRELIERVLKEDCDV